MKELFLKREYIQRLRNLRVDENPVFGKMNVQQMVEHMAHSFRMANGTDHYEPLYDNVITERNYRFMMSDRSFRDNTKTPLLGDDPPPLIYNNPEEALQDLEKEIRIFFEVFEKDNLRVLNPIFGNLNRNEWIHLLYKHAWHHLRQFGINE